MVRAAGREKSFISCSKRPDRLCGPPSLMSLGSEGTFPNAIKLTTRPHLLLRLEWMVYVPWWPSEFFGLQGQYVCPEVSEGPCDCMFKVTKWFMWMTEQCSIETSQPAFDLKRCKNSEDHRFNNSHCENTKTYNSTCTYLNKFGRSRQRPPLWSSGQSFWLQIQRSRVRSPALPDFLSSSGFGTVSTQPREVNWGATWMKKVAAPGLENRD